MLFLGDVMIKYQVYKSAELVNHQLLEMCRDGRIVSSVRARPRMSALPASPREATRKSKYEITVDDNSYYLIGSSLLEIFRLAMLIWKPSDWPIDSTLPLYF